jgi:hypothetical protein
MAFRTGNKREVPWPFDVLIGTSSSTMVGYVLGLKDAESKTLVTASLMPGMNATPTEYKYGALSPQVESTFAQTRFTGGFGQRYFAEDQDESRYYWAIGVDCAAEPGPVLGPLITVVTPSPTVDATNGISRFWTQAIAGTNNLFALNGRYALWRNGGDAAGDWDVSQDFGAGNVATDVITWAQNTGTGGTTYAFVALGDGAGDFLWRFDAATGTTTWAQHASLQALCFCKGNGNYLYRAYSQNLVARCVGTADPWTAGNWVDVARVGDATSAIVRMATHPDGTLYIFKQDGTFVIEEDGTVRQLHSSLQYVTHADDGKVVAPSANGLMVTYGYNFHEIQPGGDLLAIGPERLVENDSDVRGYVSAAIWTDWGAVCGIWNSDDSVSHVLKWGSWITGPDGLAHRADAWHGSISEQYTSKITALGRSTVGAATAHERVYIGFQNGAIGYYLLNCTANPKGCSHYRYRAANLTGYTATAGLLYTSNFDGRFPVDMKHLHWVAVTLADGSAPGVELEAINTVIIDNDDLIGTGTGGTRGSRGWGTATNLSSGALPPGQRTDAPAGLDFVKLALEMQFVNILGVDTTLSAQLSGWGVGYALRPVVTLAYELYVLCEDGLLARDGHPLKIGASQIRHNLFHFATRTTDLLIRLPGVAGAVNVGGTVPVGAQSPQRVAMWEWEETMAWDPRGQGLWREAIRLRLLQTQARTANYGDGTWTIAS